MPSIDTIELLRDAVTYDAQLVARCSCGHSGPIDAAAALRHSGRENASIAGLRPDLHCRRCGARGSSRGSGIVILLTLPDGAQRIY